MMELLVLFIISIIICLIVLGIDYVNTQKLKKYMMEEEHKVYNYIDKIIDSNSRYKKNI